MKHKPLFSATQINNVRIGFKKKPKQTTTNLHYPMLVHGLGARANYKVRMYH